MILTTVIVLLIFHWSASRPWLFPEPGDYVASVGILLANKYKVLVTGGIIGLIIGYLVPYAFREQGVAGGRGQATETS